MPGPQSSPPAAVTVQSRLRASQATLRFQAILDHVELLIRRAGDHLVAVSTQGRRNGWRVIDPGVSVDIAAIARHVAEKRSIAQPPRSLIWTRKRCGIALPG